MKQPLSYPRLFAEILAVVAGVGMVVMFTLPVVAPRVEGVSEAELFVVLLSIFAAPLSAWRVVAALRRANTPLDLTMARKPRLVLGTAITLFAGLVITGLATSLTNHEVKGEASRRFEQLTERLVGEAERRISHPIHALSGAKAIYAAGKSVDRREFEAFVKSGNLPEEFPGAIGFGFIQRVMRTDLDAFIAAERTDDAPDFAVSSLATPGSPLEHAPDLYVVKHCFPKERNARAWGVDAGSDPINREAIERAAVTDQPVLSGETSLWQNGEHKRGFIFYLPIYKNGTNPKTPAERMAALAGLVFTPIVLDETLVGITDSTHGELDFEILEGTLTSNNTTLLDLDGHLAGVKGRIDQSAFTGRMFTGITTANIGGRTWTFTTSTTHKFNATIDRSTPVTVAVCGTALSILLAGIIWVLGASRERAILMAKKMTADLSSAKTAADRLAEVVRRTSNAVVVTDVRGFIEWVNEGFTRVTGYTLDEVKGRKPGEMLQGPLSDPAAIAKMRDAVATGTSVSVEIVNYGKNREPYTLQIELTPLRDEAGAVTGFMAIESDITERKQAEAELAASEAHVRAALDASPVPMAINVHDKITFLNPAFVRTFGYDTTDIPTLAEWWPKAYPDPAYQQDVAASWSAALQISEQTGERFKPMELQIRTKSGDDLVALVNAEPIGDKSEGTVLVMLYDITERKRTELELARMSAILERTGELAQVGGWSVDLATMKLSWTRETFRIAEIEASNEPDLQAGMNLFAPEARPVIAAAVQAAMDTGTPYDLELPLITAKGRHRWVKTQGYAELHDGKATRLYGTFQDITARRQAEMELQEINERFQLATRAGGVGTWEYRVQENKLTWDDQMFWLYGITPEQFGGAYEAWRSGVHPDDRARCDDEIQRALRGEKDFDTEFRVAWPDGTIRHIRGIATIQRDDTGQPIRMVGTNWDVTEKKLQEAQIRDTNQQLALALRAAEAASRAKSAFLANMSHEIRTPLTAILGFTDLLREDGDPSLATPQRMQTIDTIKNAGEHLLTVINDILDLSKIEADKMSVESIDLSLVELLHSVQSLIRPRASGKGLTLTTVLATPVPERIVTDPTRLRQILMNLVGNAVKFTSTGSVTVTVSCTEVHETQNLVIDVEDTGTGMSKEQAERLFQAFGQGDETMTRRFGGTGLGLTISQRLAALMGGDVTLARSEPGKGSCFRVRLPLKASAGAAMVTQLDVVTAATPRVALTSSTRLNGRVLLAEDGEDNQRLIEFHLTRVGAEVAIADNGKTALAMLDSAAGEGKPFDLLLTDMQMPEMDGYTLARTLRERGSTMPIVALTAHAMAEDRDKCIAAGCDAYTTKPIDKIKLLAVISEWMSKPGGSATTARAA